MFLLLYVILETTKLSKDLNMTDSQIIFLTVSYPKFLFSYKCLILKTSCRWISQYCSMLPLLFYNTALQCVNAVKTKIIFKQGSF